MRSAQAGPSLRAAASAGARRTWPRARQTEEESRRRFIRQLDHELKNPLTGLRAALANLGGSVEGEEGAALTDANRQSSRLSRLVADLRKLAELEERPLEPEVVDVGELLTETVDAVLALPQHSGRTVTCVIPRVPWPLPPVTGDRDLLGLVFYNLLENALKYSGPQDEVEIRAAEDGPWINIEVADSGPGIAAGDLPRVFEELYRGANARGLEGAGLGLALAQRVITRHAGEIEVRSRQAGSRAPCFACVSENKMCFYLLWRGVASPQ